MCGIAGWVDFERDLRQERETARRMADTMVCRGPDAGGVWLDRHVALAHRRLAVIDVEGGRQPMEVEHEGRAVAAMTYSGEVYNHRELRRDLETRGHRFRTASDTEVVLRAYLEWGEDFAERLNGMYAFGIWDPQRTQLLLVRDRMGVKPLYYTATSHGVLFGSEPKAILANPLAEPIVEAEGLREMLAFVKTPRTPSYRDMYEVEPGEIVRVRPEGISTRRYWQLTAREHRDDLDTTIATVRELLEDIVERQLISDVPRCSLLSGGLDSSVITALSAKKLREQGAGPIKSYAVDFVGYAENFTEEVGRGSPDAPYARELAEHVGAEHRTITLSPAQLSERPYRQAVLHAYDLPVAIGDMDTSVYLLFAALREQSTVAMSGESADEVFAGYRWFHDEAMLSADTFPWLADPDHSYGGEGSAATTLLSPELWQRLDLPNYRRQRYHEALRDVPRLEGESGKEARMREVSHLNLTRFVRLLLDRKDRMSMATGLEVRVPFCDHRLVEYVFNTPWAMKNFDGREKSLLRAAAGELLPESITRRKKVHYPSTQDTDYERAVRAELSALLDDSDAPVAPLVDTARARELLRTEVGGSSEHFQRRSMENVIQIDHWMRDYGVSLKLD